MAKKILIIDDEASFCKLLKLRLEESREYEAMTANTGETGLELVKQHKPDLVLLDIMMPGKSGLDILKQIKAIAPETPVAMVTASWSQQESKRAFEAGAYEYITKPVDFDYLKTALLVKLM